jgi:transposase-like protein
MSMRAVPFYCPYCAEQSIEPVGEGRDYYCESCGRRFEVRFKGVDESEAQGTVSSSP